jgi:hypothetical protein
MYTRCSSSWPHVERLHGHILDVVLESLQEPASPAIASFIEDPIAIVVLGYLRLGAALQA